MDETITTPGGDVAVKFDNGDEVTEVAGSVTLAIGGFVDVHGSFGFKEQRAARSWPASRA